MEQDRLFGILRKDGTLEIESNDRELRITLSRAWIERDGTPINCFQTTYYVKEGISWVETLTSSNYNSTDEFLDAISFAEDFSLARKEIEEQRKKNLLNDNK